jgi:phosphoribosylglycinamide formyltransferase 1
VSRKRVAVMVSGRGSNMTALIEAARTDGYPAAIALVLSNKPEALALDVARREGIETVALSHRGFDGREAYDRAVQAELDAHGIELVALAGFMRLLSPWFCEHWKGRMINIHPSLLPAFKGLDTHVRALAAGVRIHGCTAHFVDPEMDTGPIIRQGAVPVLDQDTAETLAARVLDVEHQVFPEALRLLASGALRIEGRRVLTRVDLATSLSSGLPDA